jgi:hypothetical protein
LDGFADREIRVVELARHSRTVPGRQEWTFEGLPSLGLATCFPGEVAGTPVVGKDLLEFLVVNFDSTDGVEVAHKPSQHEERQFPFQKV